MFKVFHYHYSSKDGIVSCEGCVYSKICRADLDEENYQGSCAENNFCTPNLNV